MQSLYSFGQQNFCLKSSWSTLLAFFLHILYKVSILKIFENWSFWKLFSTFHNFHSLDFKMLSSLVILLEIQTEWKAFNENRSTLSKHIYLLSLSPNTKPRQGAWLHWWWLWKLLFVISFDVKHPFSEGCIFPQQTHSSKSRNTFSHFDDDDNESKYEHFVPRFVEEPPGHDAWGTAVEKTKILRHEGMKIPFVLLVANVDYCRSRTHKTFSL